MERRKDFKSGYWKIKCRSCGRVFVVGPEIGRVPIHSPQKDSVGDRRGGGICEGSDAPGDIVEVVP